MYHNGASFPKFLHNPGASEVPTREERFADGSTSEKLLGQEKKARLTNSSMESARTVHLDLSPGSDELFAAIIVLAHPNQHSFCVVEDVTNSLHLLRLLSEAILSDAEEVDPEWSRRT